MDIGVLSGYPDPQSLNAMCIVPRRGARQTGRLNQVGTTRLTVFLTKIYKYLVLGYASRTRKDSHFRFDRFLIFPPLFLSFCYRSWAQSYRLYDTGLYESAEALGPIKSTKLSTVPTHAQMPAPREPMRKRCICNVMWIAVCRY